jgi:3-deoxy-D-manno-octulosonic acid kinase
MPSHRALARHPLLSEFRLVEERWLRALVHTRFTAELERIVAAARADAAAGDGEHVAGGRVPHPLLRLEDGSALVVRRYRRGGLLRHVNEATYLGGHRAFHEALVTERARAGGVRVPEVAAAVELPGRLGYRAALATALIAGARESAAWMPEAAPAERIAMLHAAGEQIGRMHAAGVAHPDINLRNLLVSPGIGGGTAPTVHLIDFDRGRLHGGPVPLRRRRRELLRLARSARKLAAPITRPGWDALLDGYGAAWPPGLRLG